LLGLLREIQGCDRVLAHGFLIQFVQFGVLLLDDLAYSLDPHTRYLQELADKYPGSGY
jgi:hypothetical protein